MKIWGSAWSKVGIKRRTFPELPSKIEKCMPGTDAASFLDFRLPAHITRHTELLFG